MSNKNYNSVPLSHVFIPTFYHLIQIKNFKCKFKNVQKFLQTKYIIETLAKNYPRKVEVIISYCVCIVDIKTTIISHLISLNLLLEESHCSQDQQRPHHSAGYPRRMRRSGFHSRRRRRCFAEILGRNTGGNED